MLTTQCIKKEQTHVDPLVSGHQQIPELPVFMSRKIEACALDFLDFTSRLWRVQVWGEGKYGESPVNPTKSPLAIQWSGADVMMKCQWIQRWQWWDYFDSAGMVKDILIGFTKNSMYMVRHFDWKDLFSGVCGSPIVIPQCEELTNFLWGIVSVMWTINIQVRVGYHMWTCLSM